MRNKTQLDRIEDMLRELVMESRRLQVEKLVVERSNMKESMTKDEPNEQGDGSPPSLKELLTMHSEAMGDKPETGRTNFLKKIMEDGSPQ